MSAGRNVVVAEERKRRVLRAIVEGYVATHEPVASTALANHGGLGVSSATIRNDMAQLEDEGLITQPHTSAGRIPTDKGYRRFVDHLTTSSLGDPDRRAISTFLEDAVDVSDVVERSVKLLSQLTRQVAVIQYPAVREATVRRVEMVHASPDRALVVVVSSDARVDQTTVALGADVDDEEFERAAAEVAREAVGLSPAELGRVLTQWAERSRLAWAPTVVQAIVSTSRGGTVERVVFAGSSHLAGPDSDLDSDQIAPVLEALEEQVILLQLLHEMSSDQSEVAVRIGKETRTPALAGTSVIAAGYGGQQPSLVGAIGPTRMDYPGTMAAVRAVARYLTRAMDE